MQNVEKCEMQFKQEANLWNHKKVCGGEVASDRGRKKCTCLKEFSKLYIARNRKTVELW